MESAVGLFWNTISGMRFVQLSNFCGFFRLPLKAEGHDVLHFSKTPIIQILFGAKGSVWIVNERADELGDHCERILNFMALNGPLFNFYNY